MVRLHLTRHQQLMRKEMIIHVIGLIVKAILCVCTIAFAIMGIVKRGLVPWNCVGLLFGAYWVLSAIDQHIIYKRRGYHGPITYC